MSLNFEATVGEDPPAAQAIQLTNTGTTAVNWQASLDIPWLALEVEEGALDAGAGASLSVSVDIESLIAGAYEGRITFTIAGFEPLIVPVTLRVRAEQPTTGELLALKFTRLEFIDPSAWERAQRQSCVVYTNVSGGLSTVRVALPDDTVREFEIPSGKEVIVCGDVVHIDTRGG